MKFWRVGYGMDDFHRFCLAETEAQAKAIFVQKTREYLDEAEEPGWEENVWVEDYTEHFMGVLFEQPAPQGRLRR